MLGDWWEFLNSPVEPTWMHTLFGGLVSAVVGAGVALLVLTVTVRTQNKGIQKQLKVQERSVSEQLRVQRNENTRVREHAAASRISVALNGFAVSAMVEIHDKKGLEPTYARRDVISDGIEELRFNADASCDPILDDIHGLVQTLSDWCWELNMHQRGIRSFEGLENALTTMCEIERFISNSLLTYIRGGEELRVSIQSDLRSGVTKSEWKAPTE